MHSTPISEGARLLPEFALRYLLEVHPTLAQQGVHQDSHEFFENICESLHSCCLSSACCDLGITNVDISVARTTLVKQIFEGVLQSEVTCKTCSYTSASFSPFLSLSLEVTEFTDSIRDALQSFAATERLDKENKYMCSSCKTPQPAEKRLLIRKLPPVLVVSSRNYDETNNLQVQLKRFRLGFFGKITKYIQFDERLGMLPYVTADMAATSPQYRLFAVVVHTSPFAISAFGHYFCYVCDKKNRWYLADDTVIKPVTKNEAFSSPAYMLFYQRTDVVPLPDKMPKSADSVHSREAPSQKTLEDDNASLDEEELLKKAVALSLGQPPPPEVTPQPPAERTHCKAGCGFFGDEETKGFCSQCFKARFPEEHAQRCELRKAKQATVEPTAKTEPPTAQQTTRAPVQIASEDYTVNDAPRVKKVARNSKCPCGRYSRSVLVHLFQKWS